MFNTVKSALSMDKYNTPSKLFLYFLETYSSVRSWEDEINTCDLIRKTFMGLFLWVILTSFLTLIVGLVGGTIIGYITMAVCGFGFNTLTDASPLIGSATAGMTLFIALCLFVWAGSVLVTSTTTIVEESIFNQWGDSVKNKYCVNINLNKIRNS